MVSKDDDERQHHLHLDQDAYDRDERRPQAEAEETDSDGSRQFEGIRRANGRTRRGAPVGGRPWPKTAVVQREETVGLDQIDTAISRENHRPVEPEEQDDSDEKADSVEIYST